MTEPAALLGADLWDAPRVLGAALAVGAFAACLVVLIVPPKRRLAGRVRPYTLISRMRLGRSVDVMAVASPGTPLSEGSLRKLFGPPIQALARTIARILDSGNEETLALKLRQAGYGAVSAEMYRIRQLAWTALGTCAGAASGLALTASSVVVLGLAVLGFIAGITRWRARIDGAIRTRREQIRRELYTINQLLAIHIKTGGGAVQAVQRLVERGRGVVVGELTEALRLIAGGLRPSEAFTRAAAMTAEAQAARTYDLLAGGAERGADLANALLRFSEDIREMRRIDLRQAATRRRAAMLIPTIAVLAPVMLLLLIAPIPAIVTGMR